MILDLIDHILILRFYDTTQGRILVKGKDISKESISWVRSNMSVVLQEPILFSGTIRDNITLGNTTVKVEDIIRLLFCKKHRLSQVYNVNYNN